MAILAQSSADCALTYNFQGTHILGASRGYLCNSIASCKNNLEKVFWSNQEVHYNFRCGLLNRKRENVSELTGSCIAVCNII